MQPAVKQVHEIEQKLAHDFEHPEVHDLSFVVRELRKAVVKFWASVDLETRVICLPGLQLKSRHSERALDAEQLLVRGSFDVEMPAPYARCFGSERRHQRREELVAHRNPFRAGDALLVMRSGSALTHTEKTATASEPTDVNSLRSSVNAPDQTRVRRIIFRMNRSRGTERHKVTAALIWLISPVLEINVHFDHVVVLVLR